VSVDPADIETKLNALWDEQQDSHTVRASLFNLIAFAPDPGRKEALQTIVDAIVERFPCRILMIEQHTLPLIDVDVSTYYVGKLSGDTVGCDLITFKSPENLLARIPYLVTPHLMADLPVYLLWGDDPTRPNPIFEPLMKLSNRLIFETTTSPLKFAQPLCALIKKLAKPVVDLNWVRLANWKSLFVKTVEKEAVERVEISSGREGIPALYLQGWLASEMQWTLREFHQRPGQLVTIFNHCKIETEVTNSPSLDQLHFFAKGTEFFFQKLEDPLVVLHITRGDTCDMPQTFPLTDEMGSFRFWKDVFFTPKCDEYPSLLETLKI